MPYKLIAVTRTSSKGSSLRMTLPKEIVELIYSRDKIKRLAMSVGLDLSELNGSKSEMAEKITSHAKNNIELISILLKKFTVIMIPTVFFR